MRVCRTGLSPSATSIKVLTATAVSMIAGKIHAVAEPYPMTRIRSRSARKLTANAPAPMAATALTPRCCVRRLARSSGSDCAGAVRRGVAAGPWHPMKGRKALAADCVRRTANSTTEMKERIMKRLSESLRALAGHAENAEKKVEAARTKPGRKWMPLSKPPKRLQKPGRMNLRRRS